MGHDMTQRHERKVKHMTDIELLELKIQESGKKKGYLAGKVGLSLGGFYNCCNNKAEWKASQIDILCDELNITDLNERQAIFFAKVGS
jgi:hypothetical protein